MGTHRMERMKRVVIEGKIPLREGSVGSPQGAGPIATRPKATLQCLPVGDRTCGATEREPGP